MNETTIQILIAIGGALGVRELLGYVVAWIREGRKDKATLNQLHISNTEAGLDALNAAMKTVEEMSTKVQGQLELIGKLTEADQKKQQQIDHRDGVIDYQKQENDRLFKIISDMRLADAAKDTRLAGLETRIRVLESETRELSGLREENTKIVSQNMKMKATLKDLRLQGLWTGDENAIH